MTERPGLHRIEFAAAVLLGGWFFAAAIWIFYGIRISNLYDYSASGPMLSPLWLGTAFAAGSAAAALLLRKIPVRELALALLPMLPLAFWVRNAPSFGNGMWFAAAFGFAVFRLSCRIPGRRWKKIEEPRFFSFRFGIVLLGILAAGFIVQGVFIHYEAWTKLFLSFPDTGLFTELAYNTAQGEYFISHWQGDVQFFGDHFEPGVWLIFVPLMKCFPSVLTTMTLGAVLLWGSSLLLYGFAVSRKLPPAAAFTLGVVWLLYPCISNMNLCYIYGFHPDFFFLPFFILFYWAWEKKHFGWAIFFWLYSLSLKETNGAFWFGWGVCQFLAGTDREKRVRTGVITLVSLGYFFCCMKLLIPMFRADSGNYQYLRDFAGLGANVTEIMLSPFLRPGEFFRRLFSIRNFFFLTLLVLPVYLSAVRKGIRLASGGVILAFLFLRGNPEWVTPYYWYQTESAAVMLVMAVLGVEDTFRNRKNLWMKGVSFGLNSVRRTGFPLLTGVLATAAVCHYFYAQSFYGCWNYDEILRFPACDEAVSRIKKMVPPNVSVLSDPRTATMFLLRNPVHDTWQWKGPADWVVYDRLERRNIQWKQHLAFLENPNLQLVDMVTAPGHEFFIYRAGKRNSVKSPLLSAEDADWPKFGTPVKLPKYGEFFDLRVSPELRRNPDGGVLIHVFARQKRPLDADVDLLAVLRRAGTGEQFRIRMPFGRAVYPVKFARPGEIYVFDIRAPQGWEQLSTCSFKLLLGEEIYGK